MPFTKYIELQCDGCGCCEHYMTGSIIQAKTLAKSDGYIVSGKKVFCNKYCEIEALLKSGSLCSNSRD